MTIQKCISSSYCAKHISPWSSVKLFIKVISNTRMRAISRLIVCKWTTKAFICHLHELTFVDAICSANENHIFYIYIMVFPRVFTALLCHELKIIVTIFTFNDPQPSAQTNCLLIKLEIISLFLLCIQMNVFVQAGFRGQLSRTLFPQVCFPIFISYNICMSRYRSKRMTALHGLYISAIGGKMARGGTNTKGSLNIYRGPKRSRS